MTESNKIRKPQGMLMTLSPAAQARRNELTAREARGDNQFLAAELSKAQVRADANIDKIKLTPIDQWPDEVFEECQRGSE
jgi:hypothetical protein